MSFDIESLIINKNYTRDILADMLGYKSTFALERGVVTPAKLGIIILFSTMEQKNHKYTDRFIGDKFHYNGEEKHGNDKRIMENLLGLGNDTIVLFYRDSTSDPFTYYGKVELIDYDIYSDRPSQFVFCSIPNDSDVVDFADEAFSDFLHDHDLEVPHAVSDGKKVILKHVMYERNQNNRKKAIAIHGHICSVCNMDFNKMYGQDIANNYIEVHHIIPLYLSGETPIDPATDLIPVCANCHRMLHRKRNKNININALKTIVVENKCVFNK